MEAAYLAVARFRKPHGLKGEALVVPLTDEPDAVFVAGRELVPIDDDGQPVGDPVVVRRGRRYQRQWLLAFEGMDDRTALEAWTSRVLGARQSELRAPGEEEMYYHEIRGAAVVDGDAEIGLAKDVVGVPGGEVLVVEHDGRDVLIPFRAPIVRRLDRRHRRIEVELPPGLLEI